MSDSIRSFAMQMPSGDELARVVFEALRATVIGQISLARRIAKGEGVTLTPDKEREIALTMLGETLRHLPHTNPYRDLLNLYVRQVVLPALIRGGPPPELAKLKIFRDDTNTKPVTQ